MSEHQAPRHRAAEAPATWLAATAQAARLRLRLVTFDADFARFQLPRWTQLHP